MNETNVRINKMIDDCIQKAELETKEKLDPILRIMMMDLFRVIYKQGFDSATKVLIEANKLVKDEEPKFN